MDAKTIVDHFGGVSRTARAFGVKPPSVSEWLAAGTLPKSREYQAEVLTFGKFKASAAATSSSERTGEAA